MRTQNLCNLIVIPIFITILFLIGCGEADKTTVDSTLPGPAPSQWFPLAVGNKWVMSRTRKIIFSTQKGTKTLEIIGTEVVQNRSAYHLKITNVDESGQILSTADKYLCTDASGTLYCFDPESYPSWQKILSNDDNPKAGWVSLGQGYLINFVRGGEVEMKAERISAPAGTYEVAKLQIQEITPVMAEEFIECYAKGAGIVFVRYARVFNPPWGNEVITSELLSYSLRK